MILLMQEKRYKNDNNIYKNRTSFIHFPAKTLVTYFKRYKNADIIWCQEEPKNMGAWNTVRNYIDRTLEIVNFGDKSVKYVGRKQLLPLRLEILTNILHNKKKY